MRCIPNITVIAALLSTATGQEGFRIIFDKRADFEAALTEEPRSTVTDTSERFTRAIATLEERTLTKGKKPRTVNWVTREGHIDKQAYSYTVYDINFGDAPVAAPFGPELSMKGERFEIDKLDPLGFPIVQDGVKGNGSWGLDSGSGRSGSKNAALFDFTTTPGGKGLRHFGLDLIDWEASKSVPAELRLYKDGKLLFEKPFHWDTPRQGHKEHHFLGVTAVGEEHFFNQVIVVIGDDKVAAKGVPGGAERWAADSFTFGQAFSK